MLLLFTVTIVDTTDFIESPGTRHTTTGGHVYNFHLLHYILVPASVTPITSHLPIPQSSLLRAACQVNVLHL